MGSRLGWMVLVMGLMLAVESEASLFCVMDFAGKRCQYSDLDSCRRAAGKQGGCVLNDAEIAKPFGAMPFCLVESWRTECVYNDMASCERRATTTRTVCIANPSNSQAGVGNSPFGSSPFGSQMPQAGRAAGMPNMPGNMPGMAGSRPAGFPGSPSVPSAGGQGSVGYVPNSGYWPGVDK